MVASVETPASICENTSAIIAPFTAMFFLLYSDEDLIFFLVHDRSPLYSLCPHNGHTTSIPLTTLPFESYICLNSMLTPQYGQVGCTMISLPGSLSINRSPIHSDMIKTPLFIVADLAITLVLITAFHSALANRIDGCPPIIFFRTLIRTLLSNGRFRPDISNHYYSSVSFTSVLSQSSQCILQFA